MAKSKGNDRPFSARVSNRLRGLVIKMREAEEDRVAAFSDRDHAEARLAAMGIKKSDERREVAEEHSDAVRAIRDLNHSISWYRSEVFRTVELADEPEQGELFPTEDGLNLKPPPLAVKDPKPAKDESEDVQQHPHPPEKNTAKFDFEGSAIPKDIETIFPLTAGLAIGNAWSGRPIVAATRQDLEAEIARRVGRPHGVRYIHGTTVRNPMGLVANVVRKTGKNAVGAFASVYNLSGMSADEIPAGGPSSRVGTAQPEPVGGGKEIDRSAKAAKRGRPPGSKNKNPKRAAKTAAAAG